ncbi:MAG: hypothetical protein KJO07_10650, partial [Deltaproteobacteria bacterium]|nr:hypothetical protein [Deltaproteobacteria bacterium]
MTARDSAADHRPADRRPIWSRALRRLPGLGDGLRLLWRAAPRWAIANSVVLVLQAIVPLVGLILLKWMVDALTASLADPELGIRLPLVYATLVGGVALIGALLQ